MRLSLFFSLAVKTSAMISSFLCPTSVSGAFSSSLSPHRHSWSQCMWPIGTIEIRRGSYRCVCWANLVLSYCLVYLLVSHFILFCLILYYAILWWQGSGRAGFLSNKGQDGELETLKKRRLPIAGALWWTYACSLVFRLLFEGGFM